MLDYAVSKRLGSSFVLNMVDDDCLAEEITLRWVKDDMGGRVRLTITPVEV